MRMKHVISVVLASMLTGVLPAVETITCGGSGPNHLQGTACDGDAIYWCYTKKLVKTDLSGAVLAAVEVPGHSGDLCVHNGKVYVATEEGLYVRESNFKNEVRVYDAATLALKRVYNLDSHFKQRGFQISCIEYADGSFFLPAGMPDGMVDEKNYVFEFNPSFELIAVHELNTGSTNYGIQTIAYHDGQLFLGNYAGTGAASGAFVTDAKMQGAVHTAIPGYEGMMSVTGVLYTAVSVQDKTTGEWTATATEVQGLDRLCYAVNGESGDLVDTPALLTALGFMPKSRYYGDSDQSITASGTEANNLIANAMPQGGSVITLASGADHAYAGGIAVASGTLEVPNAAAIDAPAPAVPDSQWQPAPVVISAGTLRFNGGGAISRDFVTLPLAGRIKVPGIIEVAADAAVTNTGRFHWTDGTGNFLKMGEGTFVLATPYGEGVITNYVGGNRTHDPQWQNLITPFNANGDAPTYRSPAFGVLNGRFVIDTAPDVVTMLGNEAMIGGPTTRTGTETAGHLDIYSGKVLCNGFFVIGRDNGTSVTAPNGLSSTMNMYGGSFECDQLEMSYISYQDSVSTCRPVLNIHGGEFNVNTRVRICYPQAYVTINIDGGTFNTPDYVNGYYNPGPHSEINVSNGGRFICNTLYAAYLSTAANPTYMRVNVTDGGVFALKTMAAKSANETGQDTRFYFNGGTLLSRQDYYNHEISEYMPIDVGEKGMTIDITQGLHWGLKIKSPVKAASGVTDGGVKVVNTSGDVGRWLCFNGGVELAGGITVEDKCYILFGDDVKTSVEFKSPDSWMEATADVTVDSIKMTGKLNHLRIGMTGPANTAGVTSYLLTVKDFTPPEGRIEVRAVNAGSTSASEPLGTFPFLRVPATSPLSIGQLEFYKGNTASHTYRFTETVADGWKTFSWVHESTDSRTSIDPRASSDWLTGSGKTFRIGPWLLNHTGNDTTANYMYSLIEDKTAFQAGGISVADSLTLTGGAYIHSAPFVKLGEGTLTLAGDEIYNFGLHYTSTVPYDDQSCWNLFDENGNSVTGHQAGVIVDAGTLRLGTGSDRPILRYPSANELWVGSVTTTAPDGEKDAAMVVDSGVLQLSGTLVVGRNRGTPESAVHEPLVSSYVQNGGDVTVGSLFVGYMNGSTAAQQDTFTLNGGRFAATGRDNSSSGVVRIGQGVMNGAGTNTARIVINGGVFEVGKTAYDNGKDGRMITCYTSSTNKFASFEMNGGEAMMWCGFTCWDAPANGEFNTKVRLNGGTITFGGVNGAMPTFNGGGRSELYWNGTVLRPYSPTYREAIDSFFTYYSLREIGPNGAIFDLSEANTDHVEPFNSANGKNPRDFTGTGSITVRGGNTNRSLRISCDLSVTGDYIAEKGGVIEMWHQNYVKFANKKTVRVKDGGGVATYYSDPIKNVYLGETAADSTFVYGYGFYGYNAFVASTTLSIKGTVYCAWRLPGYDIALRLPKGTYPILRGPKGSFADVDVATQFKLHPSLVRDGVTVTFALDTSNANYDQVTVASSDYVYYVESPTHQLQPGSGRTNVYDASKPVSGTVTFYGESQSRPAEDPYTSGGGTVRVEEPLSGSGTIKLTSGRIEGRPEYFNGVSLDLQNATVRFTESGVTTANLKSLAEGATGMGVEVPEGKTVYATGTFTNNSELLKLDGGTLVLQDDSPYVLLGAGNKKNDTAWTSSNVPTNGDIPNVPSLAVFAGTLVLDMPGKVVVDSTNAQDRVWVGGHPIPDGKGSAWPAVMEIWQGDFIHTNENFCIGRRVDATWDGVKYASFTKRPYVGMNLRGGSVKVKGLILGYGNYKWVDCSYDELNIYDGLFEVGVERLAIGHMGSDVKIGDDEQESVVNVYGGELRKLSGNAFAVGGYYSNAGRTYPGRGTLNVYGGEVNAANTINVPQSANCIGKVNLYGGVVQAQNFNRNNSSSGTEGYIHFDGGTFRPLQNDGSLAGFSAVTVGAGGGIIDVPADHTYNVSQLAHDSTLGDTADGGFGASGEGTLILRVANGFTGPTRVKGGATLKQGVAGAFSGSAELEGGTLNLNGIATTFGTVKGHGAVIGDLTVTESLELDGELAVTGNLTLADGAVLKMSVSDDGTALSWLGVTGTLAGGRNVTVSFGRYDDTAFEDDLTVQIGEVGSGSSFSAQAVRATTGNAMQASVSLSGGKLMLGVHKRGLVLRFR